MPRLLAFLRALLPREVPWQQRLGVAGRPWNAVGARMLAAHIAFADRPVSYSTEGFVMKKGALR